MKQARWISLVLFLVLINSSLHADNHNIYPLPEERGSAGTLAALEKLNVYVRVLHTTAHPDDESSGTLTWLSRKFHAQTTLYCLTRGEGGQNILGSEKYDALGLVRTGELLEASHYYGSDLKFSGAVDFGFSKTAEETLAKWDREATLEEMVRLIRQWRPAIILSRFGGTAADGHGHHQAVGLLTREAFRAAADPKRFPQHLEQGLPPWQAQKLYVSTMGEFSENGSNQASADWTVRIPVGDFNPVLGRSYREIAAEGYSKHRTQGNGAQYSLPGSAFEYFKLVEATTERKPKENSLFDSINTSLTAIYDLAGNEKNKVPFLAESLAEVSQTAQSALNVFQVTSPEKSAEAIASGIRILAADISKVANASLSAPAKRILLEALQAKESDFHEALNAVLGISFIAIADTKFGVPGDKASTTLYFYNRGKETVTLKDMKLKAPGVVAPAESDLPFGEQPPASFARYRYTVAISPEAHESEPFWYLSEKSPAHYQFKQTADTLAPFGDAAITAEAVYRFRNIEVPVKTIVRSQAGDANRGADFVDFQLVPALSVSLKPDLIIAPQPAGSDTYTLQASILNNRKDAAQGTLKLELPQGWQAQPSQSEFTLARNGEVFAKSFTIILPPNTSAGEYSIQAVASMNGQEFRKEHQIISYPENWTRYLYRPAQTMFKKFPLTIDPNLFVGYIPGSGDEIPEVLQQLGIKIKFLSDSDLAFGDLKNFAAIITGIRAYNVNDSLRKNNQRLLNYVADGGTLIVQYARPMGMPSRMGGGSPFLFGPYPMSVSNDSRITVEDSPLKILNPSHPLFNRPNKITEADFQGWVQERGLYFMDTWDSQYTALLAGNDPGEESKNGGMLYTHYGKGHYLYTGYSWFRQLPAGVPGAYRIFANMISLSSSGQ
jgi:LmbE family N-acetylglucosaminyl deacetylase